MKKFAMIVMAIFLVVVIVSWGCESGDKDGKDQAKIGKKDGKDKKGKSFDKDGKKHKKKGHRRDGKRRKNKKNRKADEGQPVELSQNAKVKIDAAEYNYGVAEQYTAVEHAYTLTNTGTEALKIRQVKSSCGCTAAKPEKNDLAPGESTQVKASFNTGNRKGAQTKTIRVFTNSAETPELELKLTGEVKETFTFDPPHTRFQEVAPDQPQTGKITVTYRSDQPTSIKEITLSDPEIIKVAYDKSVQFPLTLKKDESIVMTVTMTLPKDRNFFHGQIKIVREGQMEIGYYVSASLKGAVSANPSAKMKMQKKAQFTTKAPDAPEKAIDTDIE